MADQDGRHSEMITELLRHVTSSHHDADVRYTIYPPSVVVIAFIFSELRKGGGRGEIGPLPIPVVEDRKKPSLKRVKSQE